MKSIHYILLLTIILTSTLSGCLLQNHAYPTYKSPQTNESITFFKDGTFYLSTSTGTSGISGTYKITDDGKILLMTEPFGTTQQLNRINDNTLTDKHNNTYIKEN